MLNSVKDVIAKYDFDKVKDLSKDEFSNLLSDVLEHYTQSEDFQKIAVKHLITAMSKNLSRK